MHLEKAIVKECKIMMESQLIDLLDFTEEVLLQDFKYLIGRTTHQGHV